MYKNNNHNNTHNSRKKKFNDDLMPFGGVNAGIGLATDRLNSAYNNPTNNNQANRYRCANRKLITKKNEKNK